MNAITIQKLNKIYKNGTHALKDADLEIEAGDFFGLMGANGAGKTTMIGILTGLINKTSGKAQIFDYDLDTHAFEAKKSIGVVPQEFNFNIFEKVQDIIVTQAGYFGIERKVALAEAEHLLKKLELWQNRDLSARMLSGGMKRRLMMARALIHKPQLLILDEPTAGVDVELRHGMWEYLKQLNQEGTTILLTTHYLEEVEQMCKNAAIIKEGRIIVKDRVQRLIQLWEREVFLVTVKEMKPFQPREGFHPIVVDHNVLEVELRRGETLNELMTQLSQMGMEMVDIRPKGHRLEKIFLDILKQ